MRHLQAIGIGLGGAVLLMACARGIGSDFGAFGGSMAGVAGDDGDGGEGTTGGEPAETGASPMSGPVDGGEDGDEGPDGENEVGDCCSGNASPGCIDAELATCVCAQDPFCCDEVWDDVCASLVVELGCGACAGDPGGDGDPPAADGAGSGADGAGSDGPDPGGSTGGGVPGDDDDGGPAGFGDCCMANQSPGCDDATVETCVCNVDAYCCDTDWDAVCVDLVDSEDCGECGGGGIGESGGMGGDTGGPAPEAVDCCAAHDGPGCDDPAIEACVCAADGFCCITEWDSICVDQVTSQACGACDGAGEDDGGAVPGTCCVATPTPGCAESPAVEACVCAADAYCCEMQWDGICVGAVTTEGCGVC